MTISALNNESSTADPSQSQPDHQQQIQTLMKNISTLSTEKSRMEQLFQNDRRKLKQEISDKNSELEHFKSSYEGKLNQIMKQNAMEIGQLKSKLIVAQHEREKEHNDSMEMMRELQKLLSDERRLKDNLEMQLNDLKMRFSNYSNEVEMKMNKNPEPETEENPKQNDDSILESMQSQIQALKQQNKFTIETEQKRANEAIERSKNLQKIHEERVSNLEEKLAELTSMIASYHRSRNSDLENISKLKEKISQLEVNQIVEPIKPQKIAEPKKSILDEIVMKDDDESKQYFEENFERLELELHSSRMENDDLKRKTEGYSSKILMLQEKIRNLNKTIEDCENELKSKMFEYQTNLKLEKSKWQNKLCIVETEYRSKLSQLEQQLQKQRDRSMNLLEEKDNELRTLKALYESTFNCEQGPSQEVSEKDINNLSMVLNSSGNSKLPESYQDTYMIHYSNELARKDLELAKIRKSKKEAETQCRKIMTEKVELRDELENKIDTLQQEVERYGF